MYTLANLVIVAILVWLGGLSLAGAVVGFIAIEVVSRVAAESAWRRGYDDSEELYYGSKN